jgi:hypothetical protein
MMSENRFFNYSFMPLTETFLKFQLPNPKKKILLSIQAFSLFFENVIILWELKISSPDRNEGGGDGSGKW